jgi:hypothetical protein
MNCQRARRLLSERLDHPLSLRTSAALCEHLADCVECTGYDERLQVRMTDISRLSALAPLPRRAYVSVQMTEPARARSFGRRLASGAAWSGGVLALLLVAAIAFSLWQPGRLPDAPPTIAASSAPAPLSIIAAPPMPDERPANTARAFAAPGVPPTPTPQALAPTPLPYTRANDDAIWDQIARTHGASMPIILRPTYLPPDVSGVRAQANTPPATFAVDYQAAGGRALTLAAGVNPASLVPTSLARPDEQTIVRGQPALVRQFTGQNADASLLLTWAEPGQQGDRAWIPYTIVARGVTRAEVERVAASLIEQTTPAVATAVVRRFYAAINAHDFEAAYSLFDANWQAQQSFADFAGGFADTARDELDIRAVAAAGAPGQYIVTIGLIATHTDGSRHEYNGTYTIGGPAGAPRIIAAQIAEVTQP